jgi:hypothetical protein
VDKRLSHISAKIFSSYLYGVQLMISSADFERVEYSQNRIEPCQKETVAAPLVKSGIYRHFKGKMYEVYGVAPVVDMPDCFYVVYRPLYGDRGIVLRPYSEFVETVNRNGKLQQRFEFVGPINSPNSDCLNLAEYEV